MNSTSLKKYLGVAMIIIVISALVVALIGWIAGKRQSADGGTSVTTQSGGPPPFVSITLGPNEWKPYPYVYGYGYTILPTKPGTSVLIRFMDGTIYESELTKDPGRSQAVYKTADGKRGERLPRPEDMGNHPQGVFWLKAPDNAKDPVEVIISSPRNPK